MKKLITVIVMLLSVAYGVNAQFKYYSTGKLTFGDITVPAEYTTAWEGRGHYFHYNESVADGTWLKIYLDRIAPRISSSAGYIRFFDTEADDYDKIYVSEVYEMSDQRFKTNIQELQASLNKTLQLRPVRYSLLNSNLERGPNQDIGFIAQELEMIIPEAVTTDDSGNKLVNYSTVIPILTGAIQEMSVQINELTELVKVLQAQINNGK